MNYNLIKKRIIVYTILQFYVFIVFIVYTEIEKSIFFKTKTVYYFFFFVIIPLQYTKQFTLDSKILLYFLNSLYIFILRSINNNSIIS